MIRVTADTSANIKILGELKTNGLIEYTYVNLENAKTNTPSRRNGWNDYNHPALFTLNVSSLNGSDVLAPSDAINIEQGLVAILGGKQQNIGDRRQLLGHYYSGNDIFVTGDRGDISSNKDKLSKIGIVVVFNDDLKVYVAKHRKN